ncbi:PHP domain-containing protein [Anaerocolumna sedimenticola]|uniref:PHP domain-containing protein n=1 Tax=Anaerocolumna sedimenticola TaxID=2696063 RepID=A0A6P1TQ23_9FIRM|nr:PHP domain-containing protein [Anaerocolumna sedimenticola]QHQ61498.1 PHP domain-containing protein [Anaerocolumna sedimenticola]
MIDLHMHSHYSEDGEYSPIELVEQCLVEKISVMSITDHNCVKANLEAQALAKSKGMKYISGIEIDCVYKNTNFHVLGYGIDFQSNDFNIIEKNIEKQSFQASLERLEKTQILGFRVTENDMWNLSKNNYWQSSWSGEMFAEVLLANPDYKNHPLLNPYRPGGSRGDNPYVNFYWDYYSQGKPCYVNIDYPKMEQIIDTIQCNNGISVLAHPGVNLKNKNHLLDEIINLGIDGIEVFSNYHNPVESNYFYQKAKEKQLIITCGSDFHGKTKPFVKLGSHHCFISDDEIQYKLLK